jgi:hypothetical protein
MGRVVGGGGGWDTVQRHREGECWNFRCNHVCYVTFAVEQLTLQRTAYSCCRLYLDCLEAFSVCCISTALLTAFAKLRLKKTVVGFVRYIGPHGTTRLPLDGFSWKLALQYFSKNYRDDSNFIKIIQEKRVFSHLAQFFLDMRKFSDQSCRENQNTF